MWVALKWFTLEWASGAGIAAAFLMQKGKLIKNNNRVILLIAFAQAVTSLSHCVFLMYVR